MDIDPDRFLAVWGIHSDLVDFGSRKLGLEMVLRGWLARIESRRSRGDRQR